jgi:hypothetical protein
MANDRRKFLKLAGLTGMGITGAGLFNGLASEKNDDHSKMNVLNTSDKLNEQNLSIIGLYGEWANSLNEKKLPTLSYRRNEWKSLVAWKKIARQRLIERLAIPGLGGTPKVTVNKQHSYDGLHIEEISWQLPYGRPTEAILLKPQNAKLPVLVTISIH